jgi:hypothetical protein
MLSPQIRRAPPGSVVFEMVGEELLRGVVLERPATGKQVGGDGSTLCSCVAAVLLCAVLCCAALLFSKKLLRWQSCSCPLAGLGCEPAGRHSRWAPCPAGLSWRSSHMYCTVL